MKKIHYLLFQTNDLRSQNLSTFISSVTLKFCICIFHFDRVKFHLLASMVNGNQNVSDHIKSPRLVSVFMPFIPVVSRKYKSKIDNCTSEYGDNLLCSYSVFSIVQLIGIAPKIQVRISMSLSERLLLSPFSFQNPKNYKFNLKESYHRSTRINVHRQTVHWHVQYPT